ncbi:MAG TPA: oxygen-dependent coproporphyrinogen oxidase [Pseudomonadales bacterium]|jgi:coproporphyrinogen III oxidase|nr:oxygen-dependent coproporphyrinogen oxidase [Pseudomonadales bacterium]
MSEAPDIQVVRDYFSELQRSICARLEELDGAQRFRGDESASPGGGVARPRVIEGGTHLEKAAVQFTHSVGASLPPAATERNPHLVGHGFQAVAISLIVHPRNPHAPTTHMNLRFFLVETQEPVWYFGGGFDLTPYYGYEDDCVHWHQQALNACAPFGASLYPELKQACDSYFFLPHRNEPRGVGGIFFDDWTRGGFARSVAFVRSVGDHFLPAYLPILERRVHMPSGERERCFQLYRRGRYAEFNLAIDRGTKYGLQSGRRVESVLASLPPLAAWQYDFHPDPGTPEADLYERFLPAKWWVGGPNVVDKSGD